VIARLWRGSTTGDRANDYVAHLQQAVLPELCRIEGYRGAYILRRDVHDGVEFTVMTLWESLDAIRKFAGHDAETAVIAPAARALLRSFDLTATHYEIVSNLEQEGHNS
jgi:heme-degrading monooxygenase HmoA